MKTLLLILLTLANLIAYGNDLNNQIKKVKTVEQAKAFIAANPGVSAKVIEINSETDSSLVAKKVSGKKLQSTTSVGDTIYKILEINSSLSLRVSYIYFDASKLSMQQIDSLRTIILAEYKNGKPFPELAEKYNMDGNPNCDLGWASEVFFVKEFSDAVKAHKKGDIFTLDIPSKVWYYVILKTFNEKAVNKYTILKVRNSKKQPRKSKSDTAVLIENNINGDSDFMVSVDTVSLHGPQSITRNVLVDRNGNFWFATWQGLIHYDGKVFTNITLKEGLKPFHVFSLLEDKSGNLWFGTIGGGVYRYNACSTDVAANEKSITKHAGFTCLTTNDGLAGNSVNCMLEDNAGNIWFGTGNGISCYHAGLKDGVGQLNKITSYTTNDGLCHNAVYSIIQDKSDKIWIGTQGGISCYAPSENGHASFINFKNDYGLNFIGVRSLIEDKSGNIFIGSQNGLCRYDTHTKLLNGNVSETNERQKAFSTITANFTAYIFQDKTGNIWLSGSEPNAGKMSLFRYDGKSISKITTDLQIFGITEDRAGNIWFGTANGVCRYQTGMPANDDAENATAITRL